MEGQVGDVFAAGILPQGAEIPEGRVTRGGGGAVGHQLREWEGDVGEVFGDEVQ